MPTTDLEILQRAFELERRAPGGHNRGWSWWAVGAGSAKPIERLVQEGLVELLWKERGASAYRLSDKGRGVVGVSLSEREATKTSAGTVLECLQMVQGFDDLKQAIAQVIESRRRVHVLLEGPPACAKSLFLMGVQAAVGLGKSYLSFGSRTSSAGLSEVLFTTQPEVLLMDEVEKMPQDAFAVLLGLMETGDVIETKSRSVRGIKLNTVVMGACNESSRLPPEFLSRFALHARFPPYTRQEFIDVSEHFLYLTEGCPQDLAREIGGQVFDRQLGDVRKARGVWELMAEPTRESMMETLNLMQRYGPRPTPKKLTRATANLPGLE